MKKRVYSIFGFPKSHINLKLFYVIFFNFSVTNFTFLNLKPLYLLCLLYPTKNNMINKKLCKLASSILFDSNIFIIVFYFYYLKINLNIFWPYSSPPPSLSRYCLPSNYLNLSIFSKKKTKSKIQNFQTK